VKKGESIVVSSSGRKQQEAAPHHELRLAGRRRRAPPATGELPTPAALTIRLAWLLAPAFQQLAVLGPQPAQCVIGAMQGGSPPRPPALIARQIQNGASTQLTLRTSPRAHAMLPCQLRRQVVESDKADMDVESFAEGILGAIVVPEGGVATVGSPIAFVAETEADLEAAKAKAAGELVIVLLLLLGCI